MGKAEAGLRGSAPGMLAAGGLICVAALVFVFALNAETAEMKRYQKAEQQTTSAAPGPRASSSAAC